MRLEPEFESSIRCSHGFAVSEPLSIGWNAADTRDVRGTVEQVKKCVDAGAEIVRITVQGKREAAACMDIREALFKDKCAAASSAHAKPYDIVCEHVALESFYTVHHGLMPDVWQRTDRSGSGSICGETASSAVML